MQIKKITGQQTLALRQQVLWPDKDIAFCQLEGDQEALHFGAYIDNQLVCVASIFIDKNKARLRKFATASACQNQGIGSTILKHILKTLPVYGINYFYCDARLSAIKFYQGFGMSCQGDSFMKSGVQYIVMDRKI